MNKHYKVTMVELQKDGTTRTKFYGLNEPDILSFDIEEVK